MLVVRPLRCTVLRSLASVRESYEVNCFYQPTHDCRPDNHLRREWLDCCRARRMRQVLYRSRSEEPFIRLRRYCRGERLPRIEGTVQSRRAILKTLWAQTVTGEIASLRETLSETAGSAGSADIS